MRLKRPAVYVPAAIAILALAALAFAWLGARTPVARRMAADAIADATGLPATIGSMRLAFLPRPAIEIRELAIAQPAGFGAVPLVEVGRARVAIPWSSVLGRSAIESVAVSEPVLRPAFAADGSDNWSGLIARLAELGGEGEPDWSVGRFELDKGALEELRIASDTLQDTSSPGKMAAVTSQLMAPLPAAAGGGSRGTGQKNAGSRPDDSREKSTRGAASGG